jgi:SAM-dependent methyltransferase
VRTVTVYDQVLSARLPEYDDWLYRYCGSLGTPAGAAKHERYLADHLGFARVDPVGVDVLDAGSGFGFTLVTLARWGARSAAGIDSYKPMVDTVNAYLPLLPVELAAKISVEVGDVMEMPYDDESFDLVVSKEAISHYRHVDRFIGEAHRVLRRRGTLLISDGNNGANPRTVARTQQIWRAFEIGDVAFPEGHEQREPYRARRAEIVREYAPDLPVDEIAASTFGMNHAEVEYLCDVYRQTGQIRGRPYQADEPPLDPDTDAVIERLFHPYELGRELTRAGFDVRVSGYWGGAGGKRHLRAVNRILMSLSRVAIRTAPAFWIAARRWAD